MTRPVKSCCEVLHLASLAVLESAEQTRRADLSCYACKPLDGQHSTTVILTPQLPEALHWICKVR